MIKRKIIVAMYLIVSIIIAVNVVNYIDKCYITFQQTLIEAEEKAKQAEEKAKQAEEKAKQAEEKAKQAEEKAKQAEEKAKQAEEKAKQAEERASMTYGDSGHLLIEDVGISVDLYKISGYNIDYAQGVVDRWNSAGVYCDSDFCNIIADHTNQEFGALHSVSPGSVARILYPDGTEERYLCVSVDYDGHNTEEAICDSNWNVIDGLDGRLYMFTCNSTWESITIACWNPL